MEKIINPIELFEDRSTAWMIRNDGKAIPVQVHAYGNKDVEDVEETIYAAEWLHRNTNHSEVRQVVLELIACWIDHVYPDYSEVHHDTEPDRVTKLKEEIAERPYNFLSTKFVDEHADELNNISVSRSLETYNTIVNKELNQEFLRARYGGKYDTSAGNREMYFRVSSVGFNWFNIIWQFVYDHKNVIDYVTIVKDEESTGYQDYYYSHGDTVYNHLPVNDFIEQSGNPHVESTHLESVLGEGTSILNSNLLNENKNPIRIINLVEKLDRTLVKRDYVKIKGEDT